MEKIKELNLPSGKVYYLNKQGHVAQLRPKRVVKKLGIKREKGYLYFVKNGDLWKTRMKER